MLLFYVFKKNGERHYKEYDVTLSSRVIAFIDLISNNVKGDAEYINTLLMSVFGSKVLMESSVTGRARCSKTLKKLD